MRAYTVITGCNSGRRDNVLTRLTGSPDSCGELSRQKSEMAYATVTRCPKSHTPTGTRENLIILITERRAWCWPAIVLTRGMTTIVTLCFVLCVKLTWHDLTTHAVVCVAFQ